MKLMILQTLLLLCSSVLNNQQGILKNWYQDSIPEPGMICLKYDTREVYCYVGFPEDHKKVTGVILIHEDWGLTDWIRSFSEEIAAQGYIVIAPDLLSGFEPEITNTKDFMNEDLARRSLLKTDPAQITSDLDAAFHYLKKHSLCNGKVVIIGFSWGGSQAFNYMAINHDLSAGFVFYGKSPGNKNDLGKIIAPVYGFYGEYDSMINSSVWKTDKKMKKLGKIFDPVIFEGGGHGFMRSGERPGATEGNVKARTAAWRRLRELLSMI